MSTFMAKPAELDRKWYIIDATDKPLGRVASAAASILRGKIKPSFTPHVDCGDFVIILNADKAVLTGNKLEQKYYRYHTGYVGGLKSFTFEKKIERHPEDPIMLAVKGMLPKGPLGRKLLSNLKVFAGAEHTHAAQNPQSLEV